jgi:hypothetical protein
MQLPAQLPAKLIVLPFLFSFGINKGHKLKQAHCAKNSPGSFAQAFVFPFKFIILFQYVFHF